MGQHQPIREATASASPEIPDKLYFRIGDVARLCEVPAYVLRFWEGEFPQLKPNKGGTGQRLYRRRDVETAMRIKRLLYDEGYTIPGARQVLKSELKQGEPQLALAVGAGPNPKQIESMRRELQAIAELLARPVGAKAVHSIRAVKRSGLRPVASVDAAGGVLFETVSPPGEGNED
jgi:DNA-binding transcriptional MerR regulator